MGSWTDHSARSIPLKLIRYIALCFWLAVGSNFAWANEPLPQNVTCDRFFAQSENLPEFAVSIFEQLSWVVAIEYCPAQNGGAERLVAIGQRVDHRHFWFYGIYEFRGFQSKTPAHDLKRRFGSLSKNAPETRLYCIGASECELQSRQGFVFGSYIEPRVFLSAYNRWMKAVALSYVGQDRETRRVLRMLKKQDKLTLLGIEGYDETGSDVAYYIQTARGKIFTLGAETRDGVMSVYEAAEEEFRFPF